MSRGDWPVARYADDAKFTDRDEEKSNLGMTL